MKRQKIVRQTTSISSQALRIPLEQIIGISCGGRFAAHIRFEVSSQSYCFLIWKGCQENHDGIDDVQIIAQKVHNLLTKVRADKRRLAQEALEKSKLPTMIFCKYCGARNKADQTKCQNCGALLS